MKSIFKIKKMIYIGIVGARQRTEFDHIRLILIDAEKRYHDITVVSGGARGIDSDAYDVCKVLGIPILVIFPKLHEYHEKGNDIYFERNELIAKKVQELYAFPLARKGGTMNTVNHFIRLKGQDHLAIID